MLGRPARSNLPSRGLWRIVDDRIIAVDRAYSGPTTVLVPSEDVLTLAVDLPFPTRAQRLANLAFAVEDAVAEPLSTLHFALGIEVAPRRHIAGVVRHTRMQSWLSLLAASELETSILLPDALTLPMPPAGVWGVKAEGDRALVRTDNGAGFAVPLSMLDGAWTAAGRPRLITLGDPLPETLAAGVEDAALPGSIGEPVAVLPPLDLCQGPYAATRTGNPSAARTLAMAVGIGVLAHVAILGVDTFLLNRMAEAKEAEARTLLQSVAPQIAADEDLVAAADRILPAAGGGGVRPFTTLLSQTSGALPGAGAIAFSTVTWEPGALDLGVVTSDAATLDRAVAALNASGLSASGGPAGVDAAVAGTGLNATLRVAPGDAR